MSERLSASRMLEMACLISCGEGSSLQNPSCSSYFLQMLASHIYLTTHHEPFFHHCLQTMSSQKDVDLSLHLASDSFKSKSFEFNSCDTSSLHASNVESENTTITAHNSNN
eukprot:419832_1